MAVQSSQEKSGTTAATLELLYHISRELASDLELTTVLQRVLQLSLETIGGNSGSVIVLDANGKPIDSAIVHTGQMYDHTTRQLSSTLKKGLAGWVAEHREVAVISDTSKDERWHRRPDDEPDQTGPKSAMSTPLLAKDELVGVMTLVHPTPGTFTDDHGALIRAIADQAGIAVLNARLYQESRRQTRAMTALAESAVAITSSLGTEDILTRVLEQVKKALDVEAVSIALANPDRSTLTFQASIGHLSEKVIGKQIRIGDGIAGLVAQTEEAMVVPDTAEDDRFDPTIDRQTGFRTRAIACAPIRTGGEMIGVIEAFNPVAGAFDPDTELLLTGIGSLAGSVIWHGELFDRLQAAHQNYRELFDDSIDLILITDWQGVIRQFNRQAAEAIRASGDSLTGRSIYELHAFDEGENGSHFFTRLTGEETVSYESELQTAGGSKPVRVFVRRIRLEEEDLLQWLLHDITERKSADALRDELISMIYHDLRSPLANVMYSIDMLQTMIPASDETFRSLIDVANRAVDRIQRLTSSLLDIKTLEAGQPVTNCTPVPVAEFISNAVDAIRPLAEAKDQRVDEDIRPDLPTVEINRDMITRVLINLLENAVKYTPGKGEIRTGARLVEAGVEVWVEDNGPGIPQEHWQGIFDKYTRLDSHDMGFGLGLAFCRLAVEGHGGSIWIEPGQGRGARFVFSLPDRSMP